jgi:catechol 2,3-dioxygenase-like lactoylglutathione lyase family enzyme
MHRSRVHAIVIDCDDFEAGERFWTQALGAEVTWRDKDGVYVSLGKAIGGLIVLLQKVPEPKTCKSRLHVDFEADDIEAELRRLESLGATRKRQQKSWWVMQDPCGNEFCVVGASEPDFAETAKVWIE